MSTSSSRRFMRWTGKAFLWLVVALLVLAVIGAIYQSIATERAERAYPPPGEMVDVKGLQLTLKLRGPGQPDRGLGCRIGGVFGPAGQGAAGGLRYHTCVRLRPRGDGLERDGPATPGC